MAFAGRNRQLPAIDFIQKNKLNVTANWQNKLHLEQLRRLRQEARQWYQLSIEITNDRRRQSICQSDEVQCLLASIRQVSRESINKFQSFVGISFFADVSISQLPTLIQIAESAKNSLNIDCSRMVDCYDRKVHQCHQEFAAELKSFIDTKKPPNVTPPTIDSSRERELRAEIDRIDATEALNSMQHASQLACRKRLLRQLTTDRQKIEMDIEKLNGMRVDDEQSGNDDDLETIRNDITRLEIDITRMRAQIKQWCSSSTTPGTHLQRFV